MDLANFGLPPLAGLLSQEDLAQFRAVATRARFEDGQFIHTRGDPAPRVGLIVDGAVRLVRRRADGRIATLVSWGPGHHYGLESTLFGDSRTHDAVAIGPTVVDLVDKPSLEDLLDRRPTILRALFEITCRRNIGLTEVYDDLRLQPPAVRLAKLLLLAGRSSRQPDRIDCSQEDLAQTLALSTVTIGQLLRTLAADGYLQTGYRSISVLKPAALQSWIADQDTR